MWSRENWKVGGNFVRETDRRAEKKTVRDGKGKNTMKWKRQGDILEMGK
jgi:hypothetical protein